MDTNSPGTGPHAAANPHASANPHAAANPTSHDEHNAVGTFRDMEHAREVVKALETRGIDGGRIALEGSHAERAEQRGDTAARDHAVLREGRNTATIGILSGGLAGALVGFLASLWLFGAPWADDGSVGMTLGMTIGLAVAGHAVGLAVAGYSRVSQSEAWETTYDPEPGPVQVAVHTPDERERDVAVAVFGEHAPQRIEHVDREGHRHTIS